MKILIQQGEGANYFIRRAWVNALRSLPELYQVEYWNEKEKSAFDVFDEVEPQVFIGATYQLNESIVKNLISRTHIKVLLYASHNGSLDKNINRDRYPILFATDREKQFVKLLVKNNRLVRGVCQYHDRYVKDTHDLWKNVGLDVTGVLLCADLTHYFPTPPDPNYANDIVWTGANWPYKGTHLNTHVYPLLYPNTKLRIKIYGSGGWNSPSFVGVASEETVRRSYSSSTICPNIFEPHSIDFLADINQRAYEIPACKGFILSQRCVGISDVFSEENGEIVLADNAADFFEKVNYFITNPDERLSFMEKGLRRVLNEHTHFHRASSILSILGEDHSRMDELAKGVLNG